MFLENKNAVIYGGGGAIGGAVERAFAREGAKVFLVGRLHRARKYTGNGRIVGMKPYSVFVVDDEPTIREGIALSLNSEYRINMYDEVRILTVPGWHSPKSFRNDNPSMSGNQYSQMIRSKQPADNAAIASVALAATCGLHPSTLRKRERESRVHGSPSTSRILFPFSSREISGIPHSFGTKRSRWNSDDAFT
jgi:hypothetical protein